LESSIKNYRITFSATKQTEKERKITVKTLHFIAQFQQRQKLEKSSFVVVWSTREGKKTETFQRKLRE
jgi:hypothetical protein